MQVLTKKITLKSQGHTEIVDISSKVQEAVVESGLSEGNITIFAIGSTAGVTTVEYEPGLVEHDLPALFDKLAPYGVAYEHNKTWGDDNGAAHLRSALLKTSLTVPFLSGRLLLGTWQQVILIDFDTRPRQRELVLQLIGK